MLEDLAKPESAQVLADRIGHEINAANYPEFGEHLKDFQEGTLGGIKKGIRENFYEFATQIDGTIMSRLRCTRL